MSKTENNIRIKSQKTLIIFANKQFDRAFENLISAEKNIHLGERHNDLTKYASASGYVLSTMQNLVNLKYAFIELRRRHRNVLHDNRQKKREIKTLISFPQSETGVPEWLYRGETGTNTLERSEKT